MDRTPFVDGDFVVYPDGLRLLRVRGGDGTDDGGDKGDEKPPADDKQFTKAEMEAIVKDRLERQRRQFANYDELKDKAAKYDEIEKSGLDDLERVTRERDDLKSQIEALTGERDTLSTENTRLRVASQKNLPAELVDRLKGSTEEEMSADADELLKLVKPKGGADLDGGPRDPADVPPDVAPGEQRLAYAYSQADKQH